MASKTKQEPAAKVPVHNEAGAAVPAINEVEKESWREQSRLDIDSLTVNHDKVLIRVITMAAIDFVLKGAEKSHEYYDARLKPLGLRTSGEKVAMRAATLATRLDRQDTIVGKAAGKQLDAVASGIEGLVIAAADDITWAYTDECVADLTAIVAEVGGIRKLADLARNDNIDDSARGVIRLDAKRVAELSEQRVAATIGDIDADRFAVAIPDGEGALTAVPNLSLDAGELIAVMAGKDFGEARVRSLHELTLATAAVSREDTGLAKVRDQDPKDKATAKRQTEPHIVFCPDGSTIIAAHLAAQASNMVRITDLPPVIDIWPAYHVMLPPQVHGKLALNIAKVSQRNAIAVSEEEADVGTTLVYRTWRVRSEAALHPRYQLNGEGLKFSLRLPTYGAKGDPRDTINVVREDRVFDPVETFTLDRAPAGFWNAIVASHERIKRSASLKKAVSLSIGAGTFAVGIGKDNALATSAIGTMPKVHVTAADFRNLLLVVEMLKPAAIDLAVDRQSAALRWTFRSTRAAYELFMPAATATGTRIGTAFQPISIVAPPSRVTDQHASRSSRGACAENNDMILDFTDPMADFALPLPAIGQNYNAFAAQTTRLASVRMLPHKLDFLDTAGKPFFRYRHALYSADFARSDSGRPNIVAQRDRSGTTAFIDSGGFGFIGGAIPVADIVDLRREALVAQERLGDAGVIVDVPTACIGNARPGAATFGECLNHTLASIDYALTYRDPGNRLHLLNMIQGTTNAECRRWYDAVGDAALDGFGFAGARRKDMSLVLELLVAMIRDGRLSGRSWFHVFGTNHPGVAIYLTAIQRQLRALLGNGIRISFDSSTSFRYTQSLGLIVTGLFADGRDIRLTNYRVAAEGHGIRGNDPWPFDSPVGHGRRIGDFLDMTTAAGAARQRRFGITGAMMLTNHSLYAELAALTKANRWFDMEHGDDWENRDKLAIPFIVHKGVDRIVETFERVKADDFAGAIRHARGGTHSLSIYAGGPDDD